MTDTQDTTATTPDEDVVPDLIGNLIEGLLDDIEDTGNRPSRSFNPRNRITGIPTGFTDLDSLTGGLTPGNLYVIASRPSMGRTTLLTDICRHSAIKHNIPAAVYTLEEDTTRFITRIKSAEARVARHHINCGLMTDEDWTRFARRLPDIAKAPLHIRAPARLTMSVLEEEARDLVAESGIRMLAVDGIQDIRPAKRSDLREREVGDVVRDLKSLARELEIPIVATSHLNRGPEQRFDRVPRLDDLRESGAITFAADVIILLHREDAYEKESPRAGEADFIVAKHRQGPTALITVAFQGHYGRFVDMAQT
jgi:replicative DNA helicase